MGFLDLFKKKERKAGLGYAPTQGGNSPFYAPFGESIYASDIIVQAIRCKANEFKKLDPRHIVNNETGTKPIKNSSIAKILKRPNEYMTTADFLEKITILLELNKNVFIYPKYIITKGGEKQYTGLYPLKPSAVTYLSNDKNELFLNMRFANGLEVTLRADEVVHWRKDFGINDFFGGSMFGGNDNVGLLKMLQRYDELTQGIAKALEVSCTINGMMKVNTYMDDDKRIAEREKFETALKSNESGILFTDMSTEYTNIPRDVKLVDAETLKFFYDTVLMNTGVSMAILRGDYTKQQKEAFYEHALEGDIISLGQAMSRTIFTGREQSFGNEIVLYPKEIQFMSMENKIAYMQVAVPAGALSINQILAMGGFPPIEGGDDERPRGFNSLDGSKNQNQNNGEGGEQK